MTMELNALLYLEPGGQEESWLKGKGEALPKGGIKFQIPAPLS